MHGLALLAALLIATPTVETEAPVTEGPRWVGAQVAAVGLALAASTLGGVASVGVPGACVARFERPQPMCSAGGLLLGVAAQVALLWAVMPEVFRLSHSSVADVRAGAWRLGRWAAAALALSTVLFGVGAIIEQGRYGQGQGLMLGSLGGAVVSGLTFDVLQVLGASRAARGAK